MKGGNTLVMVFQNEVKVNAELQVRISTAHHFNSLSSRGFKLTRALINKRVGQQQSFAFDAMIQTIRLETKSSRTS